MKKIHPLHGSMERAFSWVNDCWGKQLLFSIVPFSFQPCFNVFSRGNRQRKVVFILEHVRHGRSGISQV